MALLDFFNSPNAALAAGLLSPNQGGSFGTSLLGGIQASQAARQNNTQDQLAQLRGQLLQREIDSVPAMESPVGKPNPSNFTPESVQAFVQSAQTGNPNFGLLDHIPPAPATNINIGGGPLVTLDVQKPDGSIVKQTLRRDDPNVNTLLAGGATEEGKTALSSVEINSLSNIGGKYSQLQKLSDSFEDSFTSTVPGVAAAQNLLGQKFDFGDAGQQSDWWRNYQSLRNEVRNTLFGGALTKTEADEFLKEDINTGMNKNRIREKLQSQLEIVSGALNRQASPLVQSGKSRSQVNSAVGADVIGRKFHKMGTIVNVGDKKYRVLRPGFDPDLEEVK